jgi:hypothetical protein
MEDGVDHRRRKLQLVGDGANLLKYLEWPEILEAQLLVRTRHQGRLHIWLQSKEHHVADGVRVVGPAFVSLRLHALLGAKEMLAHFR